MIQHNFALRGGFGSQKKWTTRLLSSFLFTFAKNIATRDPVSYRLAKEKNTAVEQIQDLSTGILTYVSLQYSDEEKKETSYGILNCSPLTLLDSNVLKEK